MLNIEEGQILQGKWHGKKHKILCKLGEGAGGKVYKAEGLERQEIIALKISEDFLAINKEYIYAKELGKINGVIQAYDIDDVQIGEKRFAIYSMDYVDGESLDIYYSRSKNLIGLLDAIVVISNILEEIYQAGYIYCDIKPQNFLVDRNKGVTVVDFGSITPIGKPVKEFCYLFDAGNWGKSYCLAEPAYVIFSLAMSTYFLIFNAITQPSSKGYDIIINDIKASKIDNNLKSILIKALTGNYDSIDDFKIDLIMKRKAISQREKAFMQAIDNSKAIDFFFIASVCLFIVVLGLVFSK